ncbi:Cytochrome oxidase assembly protein 1 [Ceraceosorus bombacis]|uniref:Cytochrome oxidase assembly protein 1 n=1 Tax=Ceraceosorus bombacis TaxID=401625 RepID=A0A0P1BQE6_9BASI|nr:Cytochrome oxidase assembly protein 1 [Ceraceosorus bombacis]
MTARARVDAASAPSLGKNFRRLDTRADQKGFASSSSQCNPSQTRHQSQRLATDASRPYASPRSLPSLPSTSSRVLWAIGLGTAILSSWALFTAHATNKERLSSSVLRAALDQAKENVSLRKRLGVGKIASLDEVDADLGDVRLVRSSWLLGHAWVGGGINMMQGRIDINFQVKGPSEETATIYFKSYRPSQEKLFVIQRFEAVLDKSGEVIPLSGRVGGGSKGITAGI